MEVNALFCKKCLTMSKEIKVEFLEVYAVAMHSFHFIMSSTSSLITMMNNAVHETLYRINGIEQWLCILIVTSFIHNFQMMMSDSK